VGKEATFCRLRSFRTEVPGWALEWVKIVVPMLVKLILSSLDLPIEPVMQHVRNLCKSNRQTIYRSKENLKNSKKGMKNHIE